MPYTYRTVKGSPLTHEEYDENFAYTETLMEETEAARDVAVSAGNFQGRWSEQHGSVAPPYAVAHNGRTWALNVELFDVTASEPSEANTDWTLLLGTVATKDTGTDPGEVPLNSDLPDFGTAATKNTGTGADQIPLNSDLGTAATKNVGTSAGNVPELGAGGKLPAVSGEDLQNLITPVKVALAADGAPPIYAIRAWVRFNGQGGVSIYGSKNIASVTYNGNSDYTVNFTVDMIDTLYAVISSASNNTTVGGTALANIHSATVPAVGSVRIATGNLGNLVEPQHCSVAIVR